MFGVFVVCVCVCVSASWLVVVEVGVVGDCVLLLWFVWLSFLSSVLLLVVVVVVVLSGQHVVGDDQFPGITSSCVLAFGMPSCVVARCRVRSVHIFKCQSKCIAVVPHCVCV